MTSSRFTPRQPGDEICPTCADLAIPVRVLELRRPNALVEDSEGRQAEVAADFIELLSVGDTLLVHAGVAIARLSPREDP